VSHLECRSSEERPFLSRELHSEWRLRWWKTPQLLRPRLTPQGRALLAHPELLEVAWGWRRCQSSEPWWSSLSGPLTQAQAPPLLLPVKEATALVAVALGLGPPPAPLLARRPALRPTVLGTRKQQPWSGARAGRTTRT